MSDPVDPPGEVELKPGDRGDDVRAMQRYLRMSGYLIGPPPARARRRIPGHDEIGADVADGEGAELSGEFDDETVQALLAYQEFFGLPETGELDAETLASNRVPLHRLVSR